MRLYSCSCSTTSINEHEKKEMERKRRIAMKKMKKKMPSRETVFALLLASICSKPRVEKALIKKCLNKILSSLPQLHLAPILSLLPSLLKSSCAEIVCKCAEIVGAASLASFEISEQVAAETEIVKGLISLLRNSQRRTAVVACNALLDLTATSVGRQRLLEFGAIDRFMDSYLKHQQFVFAVDMPILKEDEYSISLLQGATTLINSSTIEQLQLIATDIRENFLVLLRGLLKQLHKERLQCIFSRYDQENEVFVSNIRVYNLVESVFRLSINYVLPQESIDLDNVKKSIFGLGEDNFESFVSEVWEVSPMLIRNASKDLLGQDGIFTPFMQYHCLKEAIPSILPSMLKSFTSCPAIASDELDILRVVEQIKSHLGYPIIYNQDIRVVKTQFGKGEVHYFQESVSPHVLSINDILECEEAFKKGYSIALRGLEFRYKTIAIIADKLASLFGQPSAGINMYLTPCNSQGLALHSDDHCVFVCQLIGVKRWKVYPRPDTQLPRLYESCYSILDLEGESRENDGHQQIVLKEGDILYIPRGFPHEAITDVNDDDENVNFAKFSLHMTLAIEIEPPFEWEGFMQVALYSWDKKQGTLNYKSNDPFQSSLHLLSVNLLRIAIKLIGNLDPSFQKACLVAATSFSSDATRDWLHESQKKTFGHLLSRIMNESKFSAAVSHLEATLQKHKDPFEHVRWMKCLTLEEEEIESSLDLLIQHRDKAEIAFVQVRSKFCVEVEFEDVEVQFKMVLEKYRKVRKQYTNGMLSLHYALHNEFR